MKSELTSTHEETIRVSAPVNEPELPSLEVMHALADPADPDQAILANVPVLVDGINYGDLVRLGSEDECGVRPILEVVVPSGHVHFLAAAEPGEAGELVAELARTLPLLCTADRGRERQRRLCQRSSRPRCRRSGRHCSGLARRADR